MMINRPDLPDADLELHRDVVSIDRVEEASRTCPGCGKPMDKLNYAYDSNVILDRCLSCLGVWVDGDEIEQLVIHRKGNPRLDVIGAAVVQHDRELVRYGARTGSRTEEPEDVFPVLKILRQLDWELTTSAVPAVLLAIVAVNVMTYIHQWLLIQETSAFFGTYGLVPSAALSWGRWSSLVSSLFIHGTPVHLVGNMLFLLLFGSHLEGTGGHIRFAVLYVVTGASGNLVEAALSSYSSQPVIGSGAAVAGILGAYVAMSPGGGLKLPVGDRRLDVPAYGYLLAWVVLQGASAMLFRAVRIDANLGLIGHVAGFGCGYLTTRLWRRRHRLLQEQ
jgi:membrane associated rhomboid family serine protease